MARHRGHTQLRDQRGGGTHPLLGLLAKGYGGMSVEQYHQTPAGAKSLAARIQRKADRETTRMVEHEAAVAESEAAFAEAVRLAQL